MITGTNDIYIAICEDRHVDVDVKVTLSLADAIKYCTETVPERYTIEKQEINEEMRRFNWVWYATYGVEGDRVRVEKATLEGQ